MKFPSLCYKCCDCPPSGAGSRFVLVMDADTAGTIDPTTNDTISYGNFPRGYYQMQYCTGAYQTDLTHSDQPQFCVGAKGNCFPVFGGPNCEVYFVSFNPRFGESQPAGVDVGMPPFNQPPATPSYTVFATQAEAEAEFAGMFGSFVHDGNDEDGGGVAEITLTLTDPDFDDNDHGDPDPSFNLYRIFPKFSFNTASPTRISGTSCTCDFTITNPLGSFTWTPVSETLDDYGGVTGADTVNVDIAQNADTAFTITFDSTPGADVTARLRLVCKYWGDSPASDIIFYVHLGVF